MNRIIYFTAVCFLMFFNISTMNAKVLLIDVDSVFATITEIREIQILDYTGDTLMVAYDVHSGDTIEVPCKWKNYSYNDKDSETWEGTYPEIGGTIIKLNYRYEKQGFLFARKYGEMYRFWNPNSILLANSAFVFRKDSKYRPVKCYQPGKLYFCPEGFTISIEDFEKIWVKISNN